MFTNNTSFVLIMYPVDITRRKDFLLEKKHKLLYNFLDLNLKGVKNAIQDRYCCFFHFALSCK
jgi:hypothetical protein